MTQASTGAGRPATSRPIFVRITIGLLVLLVLCGAVIALLLAQNSGDGGYSWLLFGSIYLATVVVVCSACAVFAVVSLLRREPYRRLSIGLLIVFCLVAWTFKGFAFRLVRGLRQMNESVNSAQASELSGSSARPVTGGIARAEWTSQP